ncbi:MAG: DNA-binding protein [Blastochloris viridis]|uniref:DNA-binding protein n=1 Tax=Blastochloris viridis TaxID=1079 RepID=A0A6N4R136_BLAVI|nr:MAG: DNA-binding protein [Blastochloris viridis]
MINYLNLRTVSQLAKEASPAITASKLRWWLFHAEENGLNHAIVKIGGRLYIDCDQFNVWLEAQRIRKR